MGEISLGCLPTPPHLFRLRAVVGRGPSASGRSCGRSSERSRPDPAVQHHHPSTDSAAPQRPQPSLL